jgi:hypothetical protein
VHILPWDSPYSVELHINPHIRVVSAMTAGSRTFIVVLDAPLAFFAVSQGAVQRKTFGYDPGSGMLT